jgi:hypothetical protein
MNQPKGKGTAAHTPLKPQVVALQQQLAQSASRYGQVQAYARLL